MKKVLDLSKKYLIIGFLLSILFFAQLIFSNPPLPIVDFIYIIKLMFGILAMTVIFIPVVAFVDWLIIRSCKELFKDYKYADRSGRIVIIIVCIVLFIKMITDWNL